jgi:flagellar protein FlgJ
MRHSNFSMPPLPPLTPTQATAPTIATNSVRTAATAATVPADNGNGGGFGSVFRQVQGEVGDFLSHGGGGAVAAPTLSPEGQAYLDRIQGNAVAPGTTSPGASDEVQQQFLESIKPWAEETAGMLGVAPAIVAAHAALESGWGQRPLRRSNGGDSNNLFGVKAGAQWRGDVTDSQTTEYENGTALKKTERFRSYPDQASAFRDYAQMLMGNPRYHGALNTGNDAHAFAQGLAQGGYATDPAYAEKLSRLASRLQLGAATASDNAATAARPAAAKAAGPAQSGD